MAKSFIDVVQDSPRTGLGISVETKKPPLSNQYSHLVDVWSLEQGWVVTRSYSARLESRVMGSFLDNLAHGRNLEWGCTVPIRVRTYWL